MSWGEEGGGINDYKYSTDLRNSQKLIKFKNHQLNLRSKTRVNSTHPQPTGYLCKAHTTVIPTCFYLRLFVGS